MSKTIDQKVVEMRFDNRNFESKVQGTLSTLDKLKQKLNLTGASKGLESINTSANKINMNGLSNAIETIRLKFSSLEVMGITALANITNSAVNAGKRIASALTIDPIMTGFSEYETKINAIQTIMSNTASKGTTMDDVTKTLDELNTYADKTIYNFAEMTRNIGTFTAAGVGLKESASAIQGIANLAAASGSTSQQASTAMYQLSQALASGSVKLMDWNSVVNAGMGGQKFQDALKATAKEHGVNVDQMIKKNGSFRESLKEEWISAEILNETLSKFTVDGAKKYADAMIKSKKWTQAQADALIKEAQSMEDAATKVKTFTQLWDTLKESAQSGWSQSWEIIIGNFEEAKVLFTEISDTIGGVLGKSADARNKVLQEWKDLGGRAAIVDSLRNTFQAIVSIVTPIKEAFREVFPPITAKQLVAFSEGLKNLTAKLKISEETAKNIKAIFKGVFSVFAFGIDIIKVFANAVFSLLGMFNGVQDGALGIGAAIGTFVTNLRQSIKDANIFGTAIEKIGNFFTNFISTIVKAIGNPDFFSIINGGLFAGILVGINKFIKGLKEPLSGLSGVFENVTGMLDDVRECFKTYQQDIKANILMKIAGAIGILAASLFVISTIDPGKLLISLGGIAVLMKELMWSLSMFNKGTANITGTLKGVTAMIGISTAVLILSSALKKISSVDPVGILKGLVGIGALMFELSIFLKKANFDGKMTGTAIGIVILSTSMLILAKAVKNFGALQWSDIGKGLTSIGTLLLEISLFMKLTSKSSKGIIATSTGLVILGAAMNIFANVMKKFAAMSWSEIGTGLGAMALALTEVAICMRMMPKNVISIGAGLTIVALAMNILTKAVKGFASMSWAEIGKGLTVMGGALIELAIALNLMKGTVSGSAALLIAAGAIAILTPTIKALGKMSWSEIGRGLVILAGAFTVIGVAGALLTPLIPSLLGLSGAIALLGVGTLAVGVGLLAFSTGIAALATAVAGGVTGIVTGITEIITAIVELIPTIMEALGRGIVAFAKILGEYAPVLADSLLKLIFECLKSLQQYVPLMCDSLLDLIIGVLESLRDHMPKLVTVAMEVIGELFKAIADKLSQVDAGALLNTIKALGLLTLLIVGLKVISSMIPGAMIGVLGMGAIIAELALVLTALGGLYRIPGLKDLISDGGDLLQLVGTALGQFMGGIAGGIAKGATATLPEVGSNLSNFMDNVQPFVEGAMNIDKSVVDGVKTLAEAILLITGTDILQSFASKITGNDSLADFGDQIVPFGESLARYADSVSGIDIEAIKASSLATKALAEVAENLPNSGGILSCFTGDNDFSTFGTELESFGNSISAYSKSVADIDPNAITASANATQVLSQLANGLPNTGGIISWFKGNNDISTFGEQLVIFGDGIKSYSDSISGIDPTTIVASATAAESLSKLANGLPDSGGMSSWFGGDNDIASFGEQLVIFGDGIKLYSESVSGINPEVITASATAAESLSKLASGLPSSGGIMEWFNGGNDISTFGLQLVVFGKGLKSYSESISGIDVETITASATAAQTLSTLANSLPNTGGIMEWFNGNNDISTFGLQLVLFGKGLKSYSESISGIDSEAIVGSATAAQSLSALANSLPNLGGLMSFFTGEQSLTTFGLQLALFGKGLKSYSESISGIDSEVITASATAAGALAKLYDKLPSMGGVIEWFSGQSNLATFGSQLKPFGEGLKQYADALGEGINPEIINASATAATALAKLYDSLPAIGGVVEWFVGRKDLGSFGSQLKPFGEGIKQYADALGDGINPEIVTASATIVSALAQLNSSLPSIGGVVEWFAGKTDLTNFGTQLEAFGKSLAKYFESIGGINEDGIAKANATTTAATELAKLYDVLPSMGGMIEWFSGQSNLSEFGTQLETFGKSLSKYSNSIAEVDPDQITKSASATKALAEVANNMPDKEKWTSKGMSMSTFGETIVPLGEGIASYSKKIAEVNVENVIAVGDAITKLISVVKNMNGVETEGASNFKTAIDTLAGTNVDGFIKAFSGKTDKLSSVGSDMIGDMAKGMNESRNKLSETATTLVDSLIKTIDGKKTKFNSSGTKLISELNKGLKEKKETIKSSAKSIAEAAKDAISGYEDDFKTVGKNLAEGFANGISANTYLATAKAKAMAEAATQAAKKALKINSPSKVFREIGSGVPEGFAQGITMFGSSINKSVVKMSDTAISKTQNAISRIADVINTDIDSQPTIRPVLDLTEVESGVGYLGSMFNDGPSIGVTSNLRAISSGMNARIQNGTNNDVVSAIDKLRKDLGNIGGNTYNVNGITYDDESNITEAVKSLIRAAKVERRI